MQDFSRFFTTYKPTDSPPIIPEEYTFEPAKAPIIVQDSPTYDDPTISLIPIKFNNKPSEQTTQYEELQKVKFSQPEFNIQSGPKSKQTSSNYIVNYFVNKGLTLNQAKGIYGNIMQESGGNITAVSSDGYNSYGLAQWTGPRKKKLFDMYGTNPTINQQLDFLWWELNNTHKNALTALRNTNSIADATKVFMDKFERPNKKYANFAKRLNYAMKIT